MPCRKFLVSLLSICACALVILSGRTTLAQGPTCCGFAGNCYMPGVFGNCGSDTQLANGTVCSPNPCVGRCCNLTTGTCTLGVLGNAFGSSNCNSGGYTFGAMSCGGSPCPATGACCDGSASCFILTAAGCGSNVYQGNNSVCGSSPCTGACCNLIAGTCSLTGFGQCSGDQFNGVGSTCTPALCNGACCSQITGGCTLTGPNGCTGTNTYLGVGSACGVGVCPQPGACCAPVTFVCTSEVASLCAAMSGTFYGVSTVCTPSPCPQPATPYAFTYQGRLTGGPANATIGTRFTLWDNLTSTATPSLVAGPVTVNGVALNASLFTAVVDFGVRLPADRKTWLQVEVNTGTGFVSLNPRQLMTFAPLAGHAAAAAVAGTASQTLCIGPGSFTAMDSANRTVNRYSDGVYLGVANGDFLVAPVNLPGGAKIDSIKAYVYDTVAVDLEFSLTAKNNNASNSLNVTTPFSVAGNTGFMNASQIGGPVVDGQRAYFLLAYPAAGALWPGNSNLAVMNVVITWHIP